MKEQKKEKNTVNVDSKCTMQTGGDGQTFLRCDVGYEAKQSQGMGDKIDMRTDFQIDVFTASSKTCPLGEFKLYAKKDMAGDMGGPMMGRPIASLDVPILKGCSGVLVFTEEQTARRKEYPCISCGRCLEACPYFLNPSRLARLSKARMFDEMKAYNVFDCVECGCCTFSCPSNIPIVQLIRTAKDDLNNRREPDE